jgi:hypothetical protein
VPSPLDEAIDLPSGANETRFTGSVCPVKARICLPVDRSQSRMVLSSAAEAKNFPSGLKAIDLTAL